MIRSIIRFISYACLCLVASLATISSTFAAGAHHGMSPFLVRGDQAVPSGQSTPQYHLFTCQVGLAFISPGEPEVCYDPYQMRHAYGTDALINAGFDGRGHTIVIVDAFQSPNIVQQLNTYIAFYGLPSLNGLGNPSNPNLGTFSQVAPDGLTPFDPTNGDMIGWANEISLDVEWSHNIAPGANIVLVLSKSDQDADILSALKYAVDNNLGDVISMSFGEQEICQDNTPGYHDVFVEATQKNITLFASSGDQGTLLPTCDGKSWAPSVSAPASDPLVTAVGGTELHAADYCLAALGCNPAANPAPGTWLSEIVWNEGPLGDYSDAIGPGTAATGGGFSVLFDAPPWQKSTPGGKQRGVPDVAYNAAILHGVLTYLNVPGEAPGFYLFGGTSCGSPQWAAMTAIANQMNGGRLGFLSKAIYNIGKVSNKAQASFHDITSGNNSSLEFDSSGNPVFGAGFTAGLGWDATTGFGSPMNPSLVDSLVAGVSPGDGQSAISTTKPKPNKPIVPGHANPH